MVKTRRISCEKKIKANAQDCVRAHRIDKVIHTSPHDPDLNVHSLLFNVPVLMVHQTVCNVTSIELSDMIPIYEQITSYVEKNPATASMGNKKA